MAKRVIFKLDLESRYKRDIRRYNETYFASSSVYRFIVILKKFINTLIYKIAEFLDR